MTMRRLRSLFSGLFVSPQSGGPATTRLRRAWEAPLDEGCNCVCAFLFGGGGVLGVGIPWGRSGHGLATLAVHTLKAAGARAERYFR